MAEGEKSKTTVKELMQDLDRQERTSGPSGAISNQPKQQMLDASDVQKKHPDKRIRWVNTGNPEKAQSRQAQGYERIPAAEGGRQVGNLALFGLKKSEYERRVKAQEKMNKDRLSAHKVEAERQAESIARELRDKHGISVDAERILIRE